MTSNIFSSKSFFLLLSLSIEIMFSACKKFVDIEPAPNLIQTDELFASDASALSAVTGVYVQMRSTSPSLANGTLSIYAGLTSDELATSASFQEYDVFFKNSILSTSSVINSQLWSTSYRTIYAINSIIENLEKSTQLSPSVVRQLLGEMKVVRALYYFYMVNIFNDIPLITSSDYTENEHKARTAVKDVYEQIINDLQDAENLLSEDYPSDYRARPNKWTASALLAKVYLYMGDWTNAEAECSKVISSGNYSLVDDLGQVFKNTSNEIIWQIASPSESRNSTEGSVFIPFASSVVPVIFASSSLINSFESGDLRKSNWLGLNIVLGKEYYYPFKYKNRSTIPVDEYDVVLRMAELYLIRSEARAHQNKTADAITDLDAIRSRAGLANTSATDQQSLLTAIIEERQRELFAEWGNRWLDLKRNGLMNSVLSSVKSTDWQETDMLYPIPFSEIEINLALAQNPGY
jgi:hypothetical protein